MSPSEKSEYFIGIITDAIKDATPRKNHNGKEIKNPVPWWDSECNKIKRLRPASLKKWEYIKNLADLIEFKKTLCLSHENF